MPSEDDADRRIDALRRVTVAGDPARKWSITAMAGQARKSGLRRHLRWREPALPNGTGQGLGRVDAGIGIAVDRQ
jgi:hypothetical protein